MDFFFEANAELDNLDAVPAEYKPFYAQGQDGKFKVAETFAATAVNIDGLRKNFNQTKANLSTVNGESAGRRVALEAWEAIGGVKTPDELKAKLDKFTSDLADGKKINPDTIRQELQGQFQTQVDAAKAETAAMEGSLKEYLLDNQAMSAIAEHKGNATLLMPHIRSQAAVIKDPVTNKYRAVAVNQAGEPLPDTDGGWLGIGKLVERLKGNKDFAACFTVAAPSGGGTPPNNGQRPNVRPVNQTPTGDGTQDRSPMDKISAGLAKRTGARVGAGA